MKKVTIKLFFTCLKIKNGAVQNLLRLCFPVVAKALYTAISNRCQWFNIPLYALHSEALGGFNCFVVIGA